VSFAEDVTKFVTAVNEKRYLEALRILASLNPDTRARVLETVGAELSRHGMSIADFIYALGIDAIIDGANPVEVLNLVRSISEDAYRRIAEELDDVILGLAYSYAKNNRFEDIRKLEGYVKQLIDVVPENVRKRLEDVLIHIKALEHPEIVRFIDAVNAKNWEEAYRLLEEIRRENLLGILSKYLEVLGQDPQKIITGVEYSYIAERAKLEELSKYLDTKDWIPALKHIAELDPSSRELLYRYIQEETGQSPENFVLGLAINAALETGSYSEVLSIVRSISEDLAKRFLEYLHKIVGYRVWSSISEGKFDALRSEISELEKLRAMVPEEAWRSFEEHYLAAKLFSDRDVRELFTAIENKDWVRAFELLESIRKKGLIDELGRFLELRGVDPATFIQSIEWNYIASKLEKAVSIEDVVKVLRGYVDRLPEDVRKVFEEAEVVTKLSEAARLRDIGAAMRIIDMLPEDRRKLFAMVFLYMLSKETIPPELADKIATFAEHYGLESIVEIARKTTVTKEDIEKLAEETLNEVANRILSEIVEAVRSRDVSKLREIEKRYGELLSRIEIDGKKLSDILEATELFIELRDDIEERRSTVNKLNSYVQRYFEEKNRRPETRFSYSLEEIDRALEIVGKLEEVRNKLRVLDKTVIENLGQFLDSLGKIKAFLLFAKALYYFDRGDKRAIEFARKAAELDPDYRYNAMVIEMALEPKLGDIECILREYGILTSGSIPRSPRGVFAV